MINLISLLRRFRQTIVWLNLLQTIMLLRLSEEANVKNTDINHFGKKAQKRCIIRNKRAEQTLKEVAERKKVKAEIHRNHFLAIT